MEAVCLPMHCLPVWRWLMAQFAVSETMSLIDSLTLLELHIVLLKLVLKAFHWNESFILLQFLSLPFGVGESILLFFFKQKNQSCGFI